jgi:succinoglycan biosynthesis protein ExoM
MIPFPTNIVIGIPTYRRPEQLTQLLETLVPEVASLPAIIIIADNACSPRTQEIVSAFSDRLPHIRCVPVQERGIVAVRNAIVDQAFAICPEWSWLAMLDDDGFVTPGWFKRIVDCGNQYEADVVGGPVDGQLPDAVSRLARNSVFASRMRMKTGEVSRLSGAQNLLISRRLINRVQRPLFNRDYGLSGGEDYEFFRRVRRASGVMVWCDEAIVVEPTPAERLTPHSILRRYYSTGQYMARIDSGFDGRLKTGFRGLKGLAGASLRLVRDYALRPRSRCRRASIACNQPLSGSHCGLRRQP